MSMGHSLFSTYLSSKMRCWEWACWHIIFLCISRAKFWKEYKQNISVKFGAHNYFPLYNIRFFLVYDRHTFFFLQISRYEILE